MLKRLAAAAVAAVFLAAAPVAAAQTRLPIEQVEQATASLQRAMEANQRITELTSPLLSDPALRAATTREALQAAVDARLPAIEAARAELRDIAAELLAIPKVAGPGDPEELHGADETILLVAGQARRMEALLSVVPDLSAALRSGDMPKVQALAGELAEGSIAELDARALALRGSVALSDRGFPVFAQAMTGACLYDGTAAYFRVFLGRSSAEYGAAHLDDAINCSRLYLEMGHDAVARHFDGPAGAGQPARFRASTGDVWRRMYAELDQVPVLLTAVRDDVAAGRITETRRGHDAAIHALNMRIDALVAEQIALQAAHLER